MTWMGPLAGLAIQCLAEQPEMAAPAGDLLDQVGQRIAQGELHPLTTGPVLEVGGRDDLPGPLHSAWQAATWSSSSSSSSSRNPPC